MSPSAVLLNSLPLEVEPIFVFAASQGILSLLASAYAIKDDLVFARVAVQRKGTRLNTPWLQLQLQQLLTEPLIQERSVRKFGFSLSLSILPMWRWHTGLVSFPCYFPLFTFRYHLAHLPFPDQKAIISLTLFAVITNLPSSFILVLFLSMSCLWSADYVFNCGLFWVQQKLLGTDLGGLFVVLRSHHCNLNKVCEHLA